jgi:hypothetical protein
MTCDRSVVSSTNKTDRHDITEILLKVVLKHKMNNPNPVNKDYAMISNMVENFTNPFVIAFYNPPVYSTSSVVYQWMNLVI